MDNASLIGWVSLFYGLYCFAAGIGELRLPGLWLRILNNINASPALPFLTGVICILMGLFTLFVIGGETDPIPNKFFIIMASWIVVEGLLFICLPDNFGRFAGWLMRMSSRFWALFAMAAGALLIGFGLMRLLL
ncbi:MAG: hypothetical protein AAGH53_12790 [Pseudomonadota bacterium]